MRGDDQSMQISMYFIKFWSLSYFLYQQNIARIFQEANTVLNMNWLRGGMCAHCHAGYAARRPRLLTGQQNGSTAADI